MIELPFHIESPLALAVSVGCASLICAVTYWLYWTNRFHVGDALSWYFQDKLRSMQPQKARVIGGRILAFLSILFGCIALLASTVALGLIQNGDAPVPQNPMAVQ